MENYIKIDGKKIKTSDETAENFRKEFCKISIESAIKQVGERLDFDFRGSYLFGWVVASGEFVKVPLPYLNKEWTFAAFDYVKKFCDKFPESYPIHSAENDNNNWIYIKFVP